MMASDIINLTEMTTSQGIKIYGASSDDNSGYSVNGAGDVNGDKYGDFIISALGSGLSYIIFGKNIFLGHRQLNY